MAETPQTSAPSSTGGSVRLGYLYAALGAALFSSKGVAVKLAYAGGLDAGTLFAIRLMLAAPIYAGIGMWALRQQRRSGLPLPRASVWWKAALVGLLGYWVASYCDFLALEFITAQFDRVILFTYPMFVVLFGAAFFGVRIEMRGLAAMAVGYLGIILMFGEQLSMFGNDAAVGAGLALASAITYALYQLLAKTVMVDMGPRLFTCVGMLGATAAVTVQFLLTNDVSALIMAPDMAAVVVYLVIGATVLPSFLISAALHRIPASANATMGMLSPVGTIGLAYLVLGETLSPLALLGTALVLAGVGWFAFGERKAPM